MIQIIYNKKRKNFSKRLVIVMLIISCIWVEQSFVLSWFGRETLEDLTSVIVGALIVTLVAYFTSKTAEKASRNKYGLDENGAPLAKDKRDTI